MIQSTITRAAIVGIAALLAVPGVAAAQHGEDDPLPAVTATGHHGPEGQGADDNATTTSDAPTAQPGGEVEHGGRGDDHANRTEKTDDDPAATAKPAGERTPKATETFTLRALVAAVDAQADTVTITITKANRGGRGGRRLAGRALTIDVSDARLDVPDANGDGVADLADVAVGDRVEARVQLPRRLAAFPLDAVAAQRFRDKGAR